jgi:Spy/CpxP family protein refolding chaperone
VIAPTLRAGLVIAALVVASAIAGAAIDRSVLARKAPQRREEGRPSFQEQEDRRRTGMLDRMTKELSLTPVQRAGLDSIFQRTDSSLRAIRRETQPRIQQVFERSKEEVNARLDSAQRAKFAQMRPPGRPSRDGRGDGRGDGYRGGNGGGFGGRGMRGDSARQ